jgi:autotransporter translocation and assembly factor TamB
MTFRLIKGCWSRKWLRRISYVLISGASITGAALWTVHQPFFNRWLITKLGTLVWDETGLAFQAEDLEFHLLQGRVILRHFSIGGDLLKADRLEVQADFSSLLSRELHIWNIEVENPVSILDAQALSRIRLKPRPDEGASPQVVLDQFAVYGGKLTIQEPAWKLPSAQLTYRIYGQGLGPNRFSTDIRVPQLILGTGPEAVNGSFSAKANLSDLALELKESEIRLGSNRLTVRGNYAREARMLTAEIQGKVDLAELPKFLDPKAPRTWEGTAEFEAGIRGLVADPSWTLSVHGKDVRSHSSKLQPGRVEILAHGSLRHAIIQQLAWDSPEGKLLASGQWQRGTGSHLQFHCEQVGLAPLASYLRAGFLDELSADLKGTADSPGDPWVLPPLDALKVQAEGQFIRKGEAIGHLSADLAGGLITIPNFDLKAPEVSLEGTGELHLGKKGLLSVSAKARVETDASRVAEVLQRWEIGEGTTKEGKAIKMVMGGQTTASAEFQWDEPKGVRLQGQVAIQTPRWHGATMDQLRAEVTIQDDVLRVENILGEKGAGSVNGSFWLTWRDVSAGQDEMDMNFQAFNLPIEEGLRAADVGDIPITGQGSGRARIHGPYDRLWVEASATAQGINVYGLSLPFGAGDMVYDITGDKLVVKDARVAETVEQLGSPEEEPTGLLALRAAMEMDLKQETWNVWARGNVDSKPLGLPGPRFQAWVDTRFEGPWLGDFDPLPPLPLGSFSFSHGRVFLDQQSLEGFEGKLETGNGTLHLTVGMEGKPIPVITLDAQRKARSLVGAMDLHLAPDSAETAALAARLTGDLLKDGGLDLRAQGVWEPTGFRWNGQLENVVGRFDGFDLVQQQPAILKGDASGAEVDLKLLGQAAAGPSPLGGSAQFRVSGKVPFSMGAPLDMKLEGTAELNNLKSILDHVLQVDEFSLLADLRPEGKARFDLQLGGPYTQPTLDGMLSLKAGRLEIRTYPQSVEDLAFNLHLHGRDLILLESDPLRGRVAQGAFQAWGVATWDIGELSKYDLQTRLEDFQLRDLPEGFELHGTIDAVLQGTKEEGGILSGTLQARRMLYQADINLRDLILASAMGTSPSSMGLDPNDPLSRIDLDLDLQLSQPWEFDTNLLKLQGLPMGAFKIQGTLAEPGLKGKMDILPGGRLTNLLPAGDIVLERGTLEWTNPHVLYPTVDLQGRVDVTPYIVNLAIRGGLDGLEMKESSTPSLRQDEITAILIDPSLAPDIGALSGPATQTAITSGLANTGSGLVTTLALANFQESLRRTFKLDRVSVAWRTGSGGAAPETSITVGKSVDLFGHRTPVVFTHQQSGTTVTTSGQVEWRFGNFVVQLGVSQSGANGAAPSGEIRYFWSPGW